MLQLYKCWLIKNLLVIIIFAYSSEEKIGLPAKVILFSCQVIDGYLVFNVIRIDCLGTLDNTKFIF